MKATERPLIDEGGVSLLVPWLRRSRFSERLPQNIMAERPPIQTTGRIVEVHEVDRLYHVEMANGCRAYAVVERKGPRLPEGEDALGKEVTLHFSPFDMSRCHLVAWNSPRSQPGT